MPPMRDINGRFLPKGSMPQVRPGQVIDRDMGFKAMKDFHVANAKGGYIDVGYFVESIATYAAANEFGTDRIPSRAFMRSTIDRNRRKYERMIQDATLRAQKLNIPLETALLRVGNEVRNDIIQAIRGWSTPPNAESTAAKKGYNAPLTETGQMQRALNIRTKGGQMVGGAPA